MKSFFRLPIKYQLRLIVLIIALPVIGMIIHAGLQQRRHAIYVAETDTQKLADSIAYEQKSKVASARQLMVALAKLPEIQQQDAAGTTALLSEILKANPDFTNIFIADRSGQVWATAMPVKPPFIISDRRYFINTLASGQLSSGEYIVARATNRPSFTLGYPIKDTHGAITGVIAVGFLLEKYTRVLERSKLPNNSNFVLLDHKGVILFRGSESEKYIGKQSDPRLFKQMQEEPDELTTIGQGVAKGDKRILSIRKLRLDGEMSPYMYVRAGIPVKSVFVEANSQMFINLLGFGLVLGAALLFASFIGKRSIVDRIAMLEEASQTLASGDYKLKVTDSVQGGELGKLASAFDSMAEQLVERQKALASSEKFLNAIIDAEPECIKLLDAGGNLLMMNPAGLEMIGADSFEQVKGQCVYPLITDDCREDFIALGKRIYEGGAGILEFEIVGLKGKHLWLETNAVPFYNDRGEIVSLLGITRDISERKRAEQTLRTLSRAVEQSPTSIVITDLDGKIEFVNPKFTQITGYAAAEAMGQNPGILKTDHTSAEEYQRLWASISSGKVWEGEFHNKKKNGDLFWERATISPIKDTTGAITNYLAIKEDITEKKLLEAQLIHSQKMESVGRLAGGIAHDFNNKLMAILVFADLIKREARDNPLFLEFAAEITKAAQHSAEITSQLLAFSRQQIAMPRNVKMDSALKGILKTMSRLIGKDILLSLTKEPDAWDVRIDPVQLDQIVMNLVINARDAMPGGGTLTIGVVNRTIDEHFCRDNIEAQPGDYVQLTIADSGHGMAAETLKHIFEPFFTTKEAGKGTGLGLSTIYGIVSQNSGFITVFSEPGKGTTFNIYLPRSIDLTGQDNKQPEDIVKGSGTVLLVEDDETILNLSTAMLKQMGYEVLTADEPLTAISLCEDSSLRIDFVVADVILPTMDGRVMMEKIAALRPGLKVLYMSGYSSNAIAKNGIIEAEIHYIKKPFDIYSFNKKILELLASGER
ncbi:MAG: PAS domain S-box protein [Geobacteraceae bacterium]|nr:PAS domain S-box protein [Geobacteraceae bacterium]